jgi:hypothetical protein
MKKYEYKYIRFEGGRINSKETIDSLDRLGEMGWQLVIGRLWLTGTGFKALFMREKEQS